VKHAKRLLKKQYNSNELVKKLLGISLTKNISLLDSCGVNHLDSHLLICGIDPVEIVEFSNLNASQTLDFFDSKLKNKETFAIFTIAYDFGLKLENIKPRQKNGIHQEPDIYLAIYDCLIIHDYNKSETFLIGNPKRFDGLENLIENSRIPEFSEIIETPVQSNFTPTEYYSLIEQIKEFIRCGDTYQTNLTQQLSADLPENTTPQQIFYRLRKNHPAPFAAFLQRNDSAVISASPERFLRIENNKISTSPIKGTRQRGKTAEEDEQLKFELQSSEKDRAENVMIVDLLRNDLGRICEFGSVRVEKLCDLEEHPTLFHLVSTVSGKLPANVKISEIMRAVFPCGSITGAPKIRTMQIIEHLENVNRGLSMGAIGCKIPALNDESEFIIDLSVAIRTMIIKNRRAIFNVGGGIVIDSEPESEFQETLTKAKALLNAINGKFETQ